MAIILEGIRVLDWTIFQQGPVASMILGDRGADVIKIEDRVGGDLGRGMIKMAGAMISREAPEFGQHTEEILTEILSCTWDDIVKLKDEEVI